jgi:hypothetical protein
MESKQDSCISLRAGIAGKHIYYSLLLVLAMFFVACEEEFIPDTGDFEPQIVVEGYIEAGPGQLPPYVILTRSIPFTSTINPAEFSELFVHNAMVQVVSGADTVQLIELCLSNLPPEFLEIAAELLGISASDSGVDFCVYTDLTGAMMGEIGGVYELLIEVEGEQITAVTTIPPHVALDSVWFEPAPGINPNLMEMRCRINDPAELTSFYRYFTGVNSSGFVAGFNSVIDDEFFSGQEFEFPLLRAPLPNEEISPETFGYYFSGDTAALKWCNIDRAQFNFWNTYEYNSNSSGPFSSYTRIMSNIAGGTGIWGGVSFSTYFVEVPPQ